VASTTLFLFLLAFVLASSDFESIIIIVVFYIDALDVDHSSGVGFELLLLFVGCLPYHDPYKDVS
jgi:hypothetical protein